MKPRIPTSLRSIDRDQLRALLGTYKLFNSRGAMARSMGINKSGKPRNLSFMLFMYSLMGLVSGLGAFSGMDVFTFALLAQSMTFFVVGMAVVIESGDIIFNTAESDVLGHRPIHPTTLLLAKAISMLRFSLLLAAAVNLFPTFIGLAATGARLWFPIVHAASVVLLSIFCVAGVIFIHGLIARFASKERFDSIASWMQIVMTFVFVGGYQLIPRMITKFQMKSVAAYAIYMIPLPPAWFAAFEALLAQKGFNPIFLTLALGGILVTVCISYAAVIRLGSGYGEMLTRLGETSAPRPPSARRPAREGRGLNPLLRFWVRDPVEQGAFSLACAYMLRDRETRLRIYPSLGMFIIMPIIMLVDKDAGMGEALAPIMICMIGVVPLTALEVLRLSTNPGAADIFLIAPIEKPGRIFNGVRKAVLIFMAIPATVGSMVAIGFLLPKPAESLLLTLPSLALIPALSLLPGAMRTYLPFSHTPNQGEQSGRNMGIMLLTVFLSMAVGGLSYLTRSLGGFWIFLGVEVLVAGLIYSLLLRSVLSKGARIG